MNNELSKLHCKKNYALFRETDGNGGSRWAWNRIAEKFISGVLIVFLTTLLTTYMTVTKLEWRMDRIESCVKKIGKVMWQHINPQIQYPFDEFKDNRGK